MLTVFLACSAGGVGVWDTGMSWGKKGWKGRFLWSLGDWVKEEREASSGFSYRAGDETWVFDFRNNRRAVGVPLSPISILGKGALEVVMNAC